MEPTEVVSTEFKEPKFKILPKHNAIFEKTDPGDSIAIIAGAGSGKTATFVEIAKRRPDRQAIYLAFNKPVANAAKSKMPSNVSVKTAHGLAFGAVGKNYKDRVGGATIWSLRTATQERFAKAWAHHGGDSSDEKIASLSAIATITEFCSISI